MIMYDIIPFLDSQLTIFKQNDALVFISLAIDGVKEFHLFYPNEQVTRATLPEMIAFKRYAAGETVDLSQLKIDYLKGTAFQRDIWTAMHDMLPNDTLTYGELAIRANHSTAIRAVASAVGKNPLTIINACHRIVPKSGGIGKFRYGSEMKQKLRQLDQAMMASKLTEKSDIIIL
ncbi:methylated-DNA--[protein]-cysteine S-methyltransferase [Leuconostoc gasicomitatum]|uniref:Methylated-DNA--protein-cysteine methyltransferase n=1 Tax=Leuconostoc gasicomitatum TaxID=115778 RepID=A0ABP2B5J4_9LACO|nr:methylated-DNA--[protein]-cysteine S-methyltransferase [Leuconostoc gasicomitatum]MBZ5954365.1 methylated-DNA--[protein]-cysteine S-methyltransferase [Leuconostoc gasicomitatum]MBZ5969630.1 methylated-DNA--[protein]-cysteine S-methyltransferase [Leuconostoc gasicomitatum]MBZ5973524.1 methylated-DNA--[protein]-cysteine S-methyltransferase [Leuconostoc gasicomitatum]CUW09115.1 Methylated-DNA--protein-cysteine methyltransferase [Leuconostoc gasicomitatum]